MAEFEKIVGGKSVKLVSPDIYGLCGNCPALHAHAEEIEGKLKDNNKIECTGIYSIKRNIMMTLVTIGEKRKNPDGSTTESTIGELYDGIVCPAVDPR